MIKAYCSLAKPGIIFGNIVTMVGGFFLATKGHVEGSLFFGIFGLSLVIGSACVFNNYMDRGIDQRMARTKNRALVKGNISVQSALVFGGVIGLVGALVLGFFVNSQSLWLALAGFFIYVFAYGFSKYRSSYATELGSIAGAIPPLVGYAAASGGLTASAWILFFIVALWQMPHFYAIALYRLEDYMAAAIPVLPIKKGPTRTKIAMLSYVGLFVAATLLLPVFGYAGPFYSVLMVLLGCGWLALSIKGFTKNQDAAKWARSMFFFSLVIIMVLCLLLGFDAR